MEGDTIMLQELFTYQREGTDDERQHHRPLPLDRHPPALRRSAEVVESTTSIRRRSSYLELVGRTMP